MGITFHYSNPQDVTIVDVGTITAATKTLDFAAYALVDPQVLAAVLARAQAGVMVRIYLDHTELTSEARGDVTMATSPLHPLLTAANVSIKVKCSTTLMHLKSYCVDNATLRDGSANFSPAGEDVQDNSLTITDDPAALALFAAKFAAMWGRPDNLSTSQAIAAHPQRSRPPSHRIR